MAHKKRNPHICGVFCIAQSVLKEDKASYNPIKAKTKEVIAMNEPRIIGVLPYLPKAIQKKVAHAALDDWLEIEEIRIRAGAPLTLGILGESCFLTPAGGITNHEEDAYHVSPQEVQSTYAAICENSIYAHMDEIRQGFLTLKGGHRVGICGKTVTEEGKIKTFREVSSLNFRVAHEILGAADDIIDGIVHGSRVDSVLIISPPQMGKTTLIRDVMRQVSNRGFKTGVADDRGELAALYQGMPQNDIGAQTDVIDNAPKAEAILMLLRTMSPKVIISDEIACEEDVAAIRLAHGTGVSIIATTHGSNLDEVMRRPVLRPLFEDGVFQKAIFMRRDFSTMDSVTYTKSVEL